MSLTISDIALFMAVADAGSIAGGAQASGVTRSAAGKAIGRIESRVGARLFNRTTRALSITSEGKSFREHAIGILQAVERAEMSISNTKGEPRGVLRLSAPHAFGQRVILPVVEQFLQEWPSVQVEASFTDRQVDIVDEGYDLVIRFGAPPADSALISRVLTTDHYVLVASPGYITEHGLLTAPEGLSGHNCLTFRGFGRRQTWSFRRQGEPAVSVAVRGRLSLDSGEAIHEAAARGLGVASMPSFLASGGIEDGTFIHLLPDYEAEQVQVNAIYPNRRYLEPRVRQFIDLLASTIRAGMKEQ